MLFAVFYGDDDRYSGGRFRVLTQHPDLIDFDEEYAVVANRDEGLSVGFFHQGKAFEFCGAGALCLAEVYADSAVAKRVGHPSFPFWIQQRGGKSQVGLPLKPAVGNSIGTQFNFPEEGVRLHLQPSAEAVCAFNPDPSLGDTAVNTQIAVHLDNRSRCIEFRYFTRFNNKGEGQATGSVFRYLGALPLSKGIWYSAHQASAKGAVMQCRLESDRLWYSGNVQRIGQKR